MTVNLFKLFFFLLISLLLLTPIALVITNGLSAIFLTNELYFNRYIIGSTKLMVMVSIFTTIISVPLAWINTMTEFWGRKFLQIFSILPLAVPAYISAYTYAEILEPGGFITLKFLFYDGFSIRNSIAASLIISLSFFPYVYILTRIAIINFSTRYIEAAKTLGKNPYQCFFKIGLPMALPGIAAGLALVLMETVNDFGVADFFGLQTLSVGVFHYIAILNDLPLAFLLALIIILVMVLLYFFEQKLRGKRKFNNNTYENIQWSKYKLGKFIGIIALILGVLPILFGFILPLIFVIYTFFNNLNFIDFNNYFTSLYNSILLGVIAGIGCTIISVFISFYSRFTTKNHITYYKKIINIGYAIPGVVIALGVLYFLFYFDRLTTLSLSTTLLGLSLALIIRLIALSNNSLDSGIEKIGKSIDDASRLIGRRSSTTYFRIILPQVKLSIIAGFFLVFVDTVKELPITLLLRPFNFDTLATSLYEYSSNEMFEYGSLHALTIICFLSIVIYLFDNVLEKRMLSKTKK